METREKNPIVLFDGVCNLCQRSVQFILQHDRREQFLFASLKSAAGMRLREACGVPAEVDSIVLIENGKAYLRSDAALRIARRLDGAWPLLYAGVVLPRFLRDALYDQIAAHRYRWFGRQEACWMPTPALKRRFLD